MSIPHLDHETMWATLRDLLARVSHLEGDAVVADGIDAVVDVLGADRGILFFAESDGIGQVVVGRRDGRPMSPLEREEIAKTFVRQVMTTGKFVQVDPFAAVGLSVSAMALGIVGALAAPLFGSGPNGSAVRGVLYVDFRDRSRVLNDRHVELFLSAAALFGLLVEQQRRGERVREALSEAKAHCVEAGGPMTLDELLDFPSLASLRAEVDIAVRSAAPVLALGESGSGKTMLAHAIAKESRRTPIVRLMLGATEDLNTITSELFGHERGAYSGATGKRVGLVEFADGGTLVLDELLNLPIQAQKLLLDFVQFGTYRPLGHERRDPKASTVRIVAATNGDIRGAIREGKLREDLYQRLAHFVIELPPLRQRRADIVLLAERFLRRADTSRAWQLSLDARRVLLSPTLEWPGNIRQLERVVLRARERAVARDAEAKMLMPEHLDARDLGTEVPNAGAQSGHPRDVPAASQWQTLQAARAEIDENETAVIRHVLAANRGVIAQAARELGIARTTLSSRIENLALRPRSTESD